MNKYYYSQFAQSYGDGTYSSCTYGGESCDTSTGAGGAGANAGGSLTDTGIMMIGLVTLACFIIFVAMLVRWWRRPSKLATEEAPAGDEPEQDQSGPQSGNN